MENRKDEAQFTGEPAKVIQMEPAMVIEWPRTFLHRHTYGKLTPFFKGLQEGRLLATRCTNPKCPENGLWLPARADCPDCHQPMKYPSLTGRSMLSFPVSAASSRDGSSMASPRSA